MNIRLATEKDYNELALMKWEHCVEDDADYGEQNLDGIDKEQFIKEFTGFLTGRHNYEIFVAEENQQIVSAMFVYMLSKIPKPNGKAKYIAYLTNVYTVWKYRNQGIGTQLLRYIKKHLKERKCELIFVWPSEKSVAWYKRNGFSEENEIFECPLFDE